MDVSSVPAKSLKLRKAAASVVIEMLEVRRHFSVVTQTYEVSGYIDTGDYLIIRGSTLQWEHTGGGKAVGGPNNDHPSTISTTFNSQHELTNVSWQQTFNYPLSSDAFSSVYSPVDPGLITSGASATASVVSGRGSVEVTQQPSASNSETLIVHYKDGFGGAAYLDALITVTGQQGNGQGVTSVALGNPSTIFTGQSSKTIVVADVNGDGHPDMVIADYRQGTVSVLLGVGNGTFGPPVSYAVGQDPTSVAVGDLNGDGHPDIAVANYKDNTVSVLINHGDGTFATQQVYLTEQHLYNGSTIYYGQFVQGGQGPDAVAIGDTNGDGKPDLIVANRAYTIATNGTVAVLLNAGGGTFSPAIDYFVNGHPSDVATADINGDGNLDIITSDYAGSSGSTMPANGTVDIILGNGNGTFKPHQDLTVGNKPSSVAVGDLNGDTIPDIVTTNSADNTLSIIYGNADGTFTTQQTIAVASQPSSVAIAYLNGDNTPDLVVSEFGNNSVGVIADNGGTYSPEEDFNLAPNTNASIGATAVTVADVTGDGLPDVVVSDYYSRTLSILPDLTPQNTSVAYLLNDKLNIMGTQGADTITLGATGSSVFGFVNGNGFGPFPETDLINGINVQGFGGNDSITIGAGVSGVYINGGANNDTITDNGSGPLYDTLNGGSGADSLIGGSGRELINGGKGPDTLHAGTNDDTLHGGRGFDSLVGSTAGSSYLAGGLGMDTLQTSTSSGTDTLTGGEGNDSILAAAQDSVVASTGNDTVRRD